MPHGTQKQRNTIGNTVIIGGSKSIHCDTQGNNHEHDHGAGGGTS